MTRLVSAERYKLKFLRKGSVVSGLKYLKEIIKLRRVTNELSYQHNSSEIID